MGNIQKANQVRLNHELLIWVGFTLSNGVWSYPDGVTVDNGVPYFPESLDAIFKWLVPKLQELQLGIDLCDSQGKPPFHCYLYGYDDAGEALRYSKQAENPALSFCLAIQKLIRSK